MAYQPDPNDAFSGGTKTPALSWKGLPIGTVFTLEVTEPAKLLQSRNFESGQPDYWDPPVNSQPKMSAVVNVIVTAGPHSVGEARSVWAAKPSSLFAAIAEAQQQAGATITAGGTLHLKFLSETPHKNVRYSAIKNYAAKYVPPADAFAQPPPGAAAPPQWGHATAQTPPSSQPAGWPGAARPAQQPALQGTSTMGVDLDVPF